MKGEMDMYSNTTTMTIFIKVENVTRNQNFRVKDVEGEPRL